MVAVDELSRISAQRATGRLRAIGGVVVEGHLEAGHLLDEGVQRILVRVDRAVENHGAHPIRELLDVGGTELGAVAVPQEIEPIFTERFADGVHILCRRSGSDFGEELLTHPVDALLRHRPVEILDVGDTGRAVVDQCLPAPRVLLGVAQTTQFRRRVTHPTGVEGDHVEMLGDGAVGQLVGEIHHRVDGRRPRSTGIHHQHPDPVAARRDLDHSQIRLRPGRIRVVDRHRNSGALGGRQVAVRNESFAGSPPRRCRLPDARSGDGGYDTHRQQRAQGGGQRNRRGHREHG